MFFKSNDNSCDIEITWANVEKDFHSPAAHPKVLLRLVTLLSQDPYVFELLGNENLKSEQESLKSAIKECRQRVGSSDVMKLNKESKPTCQTNSSAAMGIRRELLESDSVLRRQYNEFVLEKNIMDEDEFWAAKQWMVAECEAKQLALVKGRWKYDHIISHGNPVQESVDGKLNISLNRDVIRQIFTMYPAVQRAYLDKVPNLLTEKVTFTIILFVGQLQNE